MENNYYPFINLPLCYEYDALEPFIDEKTMHLHHDKHLEAYINNLNKSLKKCPNLQKLSLQQLTKYSDTLICRNAGGVYNHRFFFDSMKQPSVEAPIGKLAQSINSTFHDYNTFKEEFKSAALSVFGSGYVWLAANRGNLKIVTTANQVTPLKQGLCPILNLDVWEHAYYLKYYNLRADYIDNWFNIINWEKAEKRYCKHIESLCCF